MTEFEQAFRNFGNLFITNLPFYLTALLVIAISIYLGKLVKKLINKYLRRRWKENVMRNFMAEIIRWFTVIIGFLIALNMIGVGNIAGNLLAGAGVSAIIIGFAFKDIAENFLSGIILAINRPFKINDIIEVENFKGPVKNLFLRVTHIRTADGRDIYIPNSIIVKSIFINYTKDGILRHDFFVRMEIADDISKTRELTLDFLKQQEEVLKIPAPQIQVEEIHEGRILLKVMFWVNFDEIRRNFDIASTGETVKSKIVNKTKDLLFQHNCIKSPSYVMEHSMHKKSVLDVRVDDKEQAETPNA